MSKKAERTTVIDLQDLSITLGYWTLKGKERKFFGLEMAAWYKYGWELVSDCPPNEKQMLTRMLRSNWQREIQERLALEDEAREKWKALPKEP